MTRDKAKRRRTQDARLRTSFRPHLWLLRFIGLIVPRRLRADWRQEWEAELQWREGQLAEWDRLDARNKLELLRHSGGAFADALAMQPRRMEEEMMQDLRYGIRMLRKQPAVALVAVVALALGIGANATMFGVVDTLLLRPPAEVRNPEQVVRVYGKGYWTAPTRSYPDYLDLRDGANSFAAVAAYQMGRIEMGRGADMRQIKGQRVTQSYFGLLGVQPQIGRMFSPEEDREPGGAPVVVLGHAFWQRQFAGDRTVIGREIELNQKRHTVIGIAPRGFTGVELTPVDVWRPLGEEPGWKTNRGNYGAVHVIARLKAGIDRAAAEQDANQANLLGHQRDGMKREMETMALGPLQRGRGPNVPREVRVSQWLAVVSLIVLLIACANVANLLLTRAIARRREIAVRMSHGASAFRIFRQLLTETMTLSLLAGAVALMLALWTAPVLRALVLPEEIALTDVINLRVFLFTLLVSLGTGIVCSIVPSLQAARMNLTDALKNGSGSSHRRSRMRAVLLTGQVALTFVLLIGAGLFTRSLWKVRDIDLGFDADRLLSVSVNLASAKYPGQEAEAMYRRMLDRVKTIPGVSNASLVNAVPFQSSWRTRFYVPGRDPQTSDEKGGGRFNRLSHFVGPDFFQTAGIPILQGRGFSDADRAGAPQVAVINEALARRLWPGESPVGKCLQVLAADAPCTQIVGIAGNSQTEDLFKAHAEQYYLPLAQPRRDEGTSAILIRAAGDPGLLAEPIRRELQALASNLPLIEAKPLQDAIEPQILPWRLGATVFALFGLLALVTAQIGLFSVISHAVSQQTHEIGIRMALGAQAGIIRGLILQQGMRFVVIGLGIGIVLSLFGTRWIKSLLFGIATYDLMTYAAILVSFLLLSVLACYLPARRATKVDPLIALRHE